MWCDFTLQKNAGIKIYLTFYYCAANCHSNYRKNDKTHHFLSRKRMAYISPYFIGSRCLYHVPLFASQRVASENRPFYDYIVDMNAISEDGRKNHHKSYLRVIKNSETTELGLHSSRSHNNITEWKMSIHWDEMRRREIIHCGNNTHTHTI